MRRLAIRLVGRGREGAARDSVVKPIRPPSRLVRHCRGTVCIFVLVCVVVRLIKFVLKAYFKCSKRASEGDIEERLNS